MILSLLYLQIYQIQRFLSLLKNKTENLQSPLKFAIFGNQIAIHET